MGLRVGRLTTLPPTCAETECAAALQLVDGTWTAGSPLDLYGGLVGLFWRFGGDGVAALRWASVLLGVGFLLAFYWAACAYLRPAGSLVGLLIAGLLPWALWSARLGSAWSAAALLLTIALGAGGRALTTGDRRWWGVTGVALGLLLAQPVPIATAAVIWLAVLVLQIGLNVRRQWSALVGQAGTLIAATIAVGLPGLVLAAPAASEGDALQLAGGLLHSGGQAPGAGLFFWTSRCCPSG